MLLLLTILGLGRVQAQFLFNVSWDSTQVPSPASQVFDDTVRYTLSITNNSPAFFADTINFRLRTSLGTFTIASFDSAFIPAFATVPFTFLDSTSSLRYGGGVNVVVIWPTSPTPIWTDSLIDTLTIITVSVDPGKEDGPAIAAFPVPGHDRLYLRNHDPMTIVTATEMQDVAGRVIFRDNNLPPSIPIAHLPDGVYFIRVMDATGRVTTLKMLKQ
jgi:hypothetical protein